MTDVARAEYVFVQTYIRKEKRDRYLQFLKGGKHRQKILDLLNHSLDYDPVFASELDHSFCTQEGLVKFMQSRGSRDNDCHLMADGHRLDGQSVALGDAVDALLNHYWGTLVICGEPTIAIYKSEAPSRLVLLSK